jgi:hypothetical protein
MSTDTTNTHDYLALEEPIREVTFMAGIARDLAYELLDLEMTRRTQRGDGEDKIIRMSKREYEQFFFAIENVLDRAEGLEKLYNT